MNITVLIVDDEPLARDRLRTLLAAESGIEVIGECANGTEAVEFVGRRRPDLVFLDINMPGLNGFGVIAALAEPLPLVVFVTAYDEHAVKAFEARALDYLLKPFKPGRLHAAVERAKEELARRQPEEVSRRILSLLADRPAPAARLSRITVRERQKVRFVRTETIDWIEASGNYSILHAGRENHVVRETLATFEQQLSADEFVRVSRSAIVRLDRIQHLEPAFNGEHVVVLADGSRLPMTRGLRDLQERLKFS
jgi:two-component system LytT family response regulator